VSVRSLPLALLAVAAAASGCGGGDGEQGERQASDRHGDSEARTQRRWALGATFSRLFASRDAIASSLTAAGQASSPISISALLPYFWVMPMACLLASMMLGSLIAACMSSWESQVPTNIT